MPVRQKTINWVNADLEARCKWALGYLVKNGGRGYLAGIHVPSIDAIEMVLNSFSDADVEALHKKMTGYWGVIKHTKEQRADGVKSKSIPLTPELIKRLTALAVEWGMTENKVISKLIAEASGLQKLAAQKAREKYAPQIKELKKKLDQHTRGKPDALVTTLASLKVSGLREELAARDKKLARIEIMAEELADLCRAVDTTDKLEASPKGKASSGRKKKPSTVDSVQVNEPLTVSEIEENDGTAGIDAEDDGVPAPSLPDGVVAPEQPVSASGSIELSLRTDDDLKNELLSRIGKEVNLDILEECMMSIKLNMSKSGVKQHKDRLKRILQSYRSKVDAFNKRRLA